LSVFVLLDSTWGI